MTNMAKPLPTAPVPSCLPVTLIEELSCAGPAKALRKLHGKCLSQLQPLPQTLQAWALLQLDGPPRLCRAARVSLASAARNKRFREKVINLGVIHLTVQLARWMDRSGSLGHWSICSVLHPAGDLLLPCQLCPILVSFPRLCCTTPTL